MEGWNIFWIIVLVLSFLTFWGIAFVVTVKGFGDIKYLLKFLVNQHKQQQS